MTTLTLPECAQGPEIPEALAHWLRKRNCWPLNITDELTIHACWDWENAKRPSLSQQYVEEMREDAAKSPVMDARRYAAQALVMPGSTLDNVASMIEQYARVKLEFERNKSGGAHDVGTARESAGIAKGMLDLHGERNELSQTLMVTRDALNTALMALGKPRGC